MLSSTWFDDSTPLVTDRTTNPTLRQAGPPEWTNSSVSPAGPDGSARAVGSAPGSFGSRLTITALTSSTTPVNSGTARIASRVPMPSATPLAPAPSVYPTLRAARILASAPTRISRGKTAIR